MTFLDEINYTLNVILEIQIGFTANTFKMHYATKLSYTAVEYRFTEFIDLAINTILNFLLMSSLKYVPESYIILINADNYIL